MQHTPRRDETATHTIGQRLARARLEKGVILADAASTTKLKIAYLEAMESDKFDDLPAPYYTRNFIKTYARYLGLDADQIADEFGHKVTHATKTSQTVSRRMSDQSGQSAPIYEKLLRHPFLLVIGIVVLIVCILYFSSSSGDAKNTPRPRTASSQTTDAVDTYAPVFTTRDALPSIE